MCGLLGMSVYDDADPRHISVEYPLPSEPRILKKVRQGCHTKDTGEMKGLSMTALAVEFKTHQELMQERDSLLQKSGLTLAELTERAEDYRLSVKQYAIFEAIADINYLLSE